MTNKYLEKIASLSKQDKKSMKDIGIGSAIIAGASEHARQQGVRQGVDSVIKFNKYVPHKTNWGKVGRSAAITGAAGTLIGLGISKLKN